MSDDVVIRVEGLGKSYRIHHDAPERYSALRDVIARGASRLLTLGRRTPADQRAYDEEFWALKDVSFEVKQGEVVGVIGRNGAGKSTLLKILSRITEPTAGRIELNGRVSSLLEVGTGFHAELTGRENIFLNGSILGMSRREVARKFDEIVAFAEVERFLDTPVKRYSSGMYMRLAFAVAAHMEPEILIVDEVLAVGDAEFQKKCLGRMGEVSREGRTVLFVSHNIGALMAVCESGVLLDEGQLISRGPIQTVAERYRRESVGATVAFDGRRFSGPLKSVAFGEVIVNNQPLAGHQCVDPGQDIVAIVRGEAAQSLDDARVALALFRDGVRVLSMHDGPERLRAGPFETIFTVPRRLLRPGEYWIGLGCSRSGGADWTWAMDLACIEVMAHWSKDYGADDVGLVNVAGGAVRSPSHEPSRLRAATGGRGL
jgi:lipopolysaccharide transport system ATP-binding protein